MSEKQVICPKCQKVIFLFHDFENVSENEIKEMAEEVHFHMMDHSIYEYCAAINNSRSPDAFIVEGELDLDDED